LCRTETFGLGIIRLMVCRKTKKRIMTRETTVTKLPGAEKVERLDLSKEVKSEEQEMKEQQKQSVKQEDQESEESEDSDSSGSEEEESKSNGKASRLEEGKDNELIMNCKGALETHMKEITTVFANGIVLSIF
jgi:hypothetical protein